MLVKHANEVSGFDVDALIRVGIRKFRDEAGQLWTSIRSITLGRICRRRQEIYLKRVWLVW